MGQKVNPHGFRVGVIADWDSKWFADKDYQKNLLEDIKIRDFIKDKQFQAGISRVTIERTEQKMRISIYTAKPGIVIGRQGSNIELLKKDLAKMTDSKLDINIIEVKQPDMDATLVAENVASQLERRISFRRAMKGCIGRAMRLGAKGIKCCCTGRLGGREIAGVEHYHEGTIPLQTIRADIEYGFAEAATTFGRIGVKVWIYKGEVLTQTLRTTPRTLDTTKPYEERRERRPRRDGDRRPRRDGQGGYQRREGGFNRGNGNRPQGDRPQGGYRKPAENKEGGAQ